MKYFLILLLTSCATISTKDKITCVASCSDCKEFTIECKATGNGSEITPANNQKVK